MSLNTLNQKEQHLVCHRDHGKYLVDVTNAVKIYFGKLLTYCPNRELVIKICQLRWLENNYTFRFGNPGYLKQA